MDETDQAVALDVLGDPLARQILAMASDSPTTAAALASALEVSLPTVYRRTDELTERDFVSQHWRIDDRGNRYRLFETTLDSVEFSVGDGAFDVDVEVHESFSERFRALWSGFNETGPAVEAPETPDLRNDGSPS